MWKQFVMKYRVLIAVEVIFFLTFLFAGMRGEKIVLSTDWTSDMEQSEGHSDYVKLIPGVYRLQASVEPMNGEEYIYFDVDSETGTYKAIRCDGGMIRGTQGEVDFEIYVVDSVDRAYITCDGTGAVNFTVDDITLTRTALGARMICFMVFVLSMVLNGMLILRDKVLSGSVVKEQKWAYAILALGLLISYFPYMTDYFSLVGDVPYTCLKIEHIGEAANGGNVLLLIPALLRKIGFPLMSCYKMHVFLVTVFMIVATYYSAKVCIGDRRTAAVLADIYLLSPYALKCIYEKGSINGYTMLILYPMVIGLLYVLLLKKRKPIQLKWSDKTVVIVMIAVVFVAMYVTNDIVYESSPTWLYNATNLESAFGSVD